MKKLLVTILLAACLAASAGCGNPDSVAQGESFNIDQSHYEYQEYTNVSDIAYVKIYEQPQKNDNAKFVFVKNDPESAIYLLDRFESKSRSFDDTFDYQIEWDGKEYNIDAETIQNMENKDNFDKFPKSWKNALKEYSEKSAYDRSQIHTELSDPCYEIVCRFDIDQSAKESEENDTSTLLKKKDYTYSRGKIYFALKQELDGTQKMMVSTSSTDEWSAYFVFSTFAVISLQDDFKKYEWTITSIAGEGKYLFSTAVSWRPDENGDTQIINMVDYMKECAEKYANIPTETEDSLREEIVYRLADFLYN